MPLLDLASGNSLWRGVDYYKEDRVKDWDQKEPGTYSGTVQGTELYQVHLDIAHPRRSTCSCAFAHGRRVICKHMVAMYFTVVPGSYEDFLRQIETWEIEDVEREEQHRKDLEKYVKSLSKTELQSQLLRFLIEREERKYW